MPSWRDLTENEQLQTIHGRLELTGESPLPKGSRISLLDTQAILCIKGEGAAKFLQGQCTADVSALQDGQSVLGAFCTNKGRVISNFRVLKTPDSLLLRMSADVATETLEKIKKYAVFFKVEMSVWEAPSIAVAFEATDVGVNNIPKGIYAVKAETGSVEFYAEPGRASELLEFLLDGSSLASESDWYAMQIRSGQSSINICTLEQYLPHQLNLDKSGAVSFTKGCYTGQEIVARTEYKGKTKRRVQPVLINTSLGDLHKLKLQINDGKGQEINLLAAATEGNNQTVASLLLPVEFPHKGTVLVNEKEVPYELLPLPYSLND